MFAMSKRQMSNDDDRICLPSWRFVRVFRHAEKKDEKRREISADGDDVDSRFSFDRLQMGPKTKEREKEREEEVPDGIESLRLFSVSLVFTICEIFFSFLFPESK